MSIPNTFRPLCGPSAGVLPPGYSRLAYIEGDGRQYINTRWSPVGGMSYSLDGQYLTQVNNFAALCMSHRISGPYMRCGVLAACQVGGLLTRVEFGRGSNAILPASFVSVFNSRHTEDFFADETTGRLTINGGELVFDHGQTAQDLSYPAPVALFAIYTTGSNPYMTSARLWRLEIDSADGSPVFSFVPAQDPSGRACLYDTVTRTPYYSETNTDFLPGPEL